MDQHTILTCATRKFPHPSREAAQHEADRLNAKTTTDGRIVVYQCRRCEHWHVGRARAHTAT